MMSLLEDLAASIKGVTLETFAVKNGFAIYVSNEDITFENEGKSPTLSFDQYLYDFGCNKLLGLTKSP